MTLDHRLDRLAPGLTARERALLSMRATLEDQREDPAIRGTMPRDQIAEFNHLIAVGNGVLHILLPHALVLSGEVEALRLRHVVLRLLGVVTKDREAARLDALAARIRAELIACWARLLAQEAVGAEIERELGDPAALPEEWRCLIADARRGLEALHADVESEQGAVPLPEADAVTVARLHEGIHNQQSD